MSKLLRDYVRQLGGVWRSPGNRGAKVTSLIRALWWFSTKRFMRRPLRRTVFADRMFYCYADGFVSNSVMLFGEWNAYDSLHFIDAWLKPCDLYLDVGANVGLYSILASRHVSGEDIVCIEPGQRQIVRLQENLRANGINALVLPYCVSDKPGALQFTSGDAVAHVTSTASESDETVTAARLDDFVPDKTYALMKLDVEGFELWALQGASRLIADGRLPAILFELNGSFERYGVTASEVADLLRRQGYTLGIYRHDEQVFDTTAHLWDDVLALSSDGLRMLKERLQNVRIIRDSN